MRQDWDYVMMEHYSQDMAENTSRAVAAIDMIKSEKRDVERMLVSAVLSAGGKLIVRRGDQLSAPDAILQVDRVAIDDTIVLTARL